MDYSHFIMADTIQDIRKDIDSVDRQIHDLLMQRADLVIRAGEEKKNLGIQVIQPDREAMVIRGLMERHHGPLQKSAVVRIWREMVSAAAILQMPGMKVVVCAPEQDTQVYNDMARGYFGGVMTLQYVGNPLMAISMLRDGEASFAVLPWPEDEAENPWWAYLSGDDPEKDLRIMVRLPYGNRSASKTLPEYRSLVVGKLKFSDSGDDHSFLLLDVDQEVSRARIVDKIKALGLTAVSIYSRRVHSGHNRNLHLVEVNSFIGDGDPRLQQLVEKMETAEGGKCQAMGGFPILPSLLDEIPGKKRKPA